MTYSPAMIDLLSALSGLSRKVEEITPDEKLKARREDIEKARQDEEGTDNYKALTKTTTT